MLENIKKNSLRFARHLIPLFTTLLLLAMGATTWPIKYWSSVAPAFGLVGVFYWSVYRPDLFRPGIVFALGLLNDLIHGYPIGISALTFLLIHQLSYSNRRFFLGQVFYMLWFGFTLACLVNFVVSWSIMSIYNLEISPIITPLAQNTLTILLFPAPAWVLIKLQRLFLSRHKV